MVQAAAEPSQTETPHTSHWYLYSRCQIYASTYFCLLTGRDWSQVLDCQATTPYEVGCMETTFLVLSHTYMYGVGCRVSHTGDRTDYPVQPALGNPALAGGLD